MRGRVEPLWNGKSSKTSERLAASRFAGLSHRFRCFPTGWQLACGVIRCYSQEVATGRCSEPRQRVANESGLCYSQKVETKAVGLPAVSETAPSAKDAKSLRPSSEAKFVGLEEAEAAPDPCRKIPQRTIHRKTREIISRAPQWRGQTAGRSLIFCAARS